MYRHAPGTIWRRALARVDRRAATIFAAREMLRALGVDPNAVTLTREYELLREAAGLANRLAYTAGVAA